MRIPPLLVMIPNLNYGLVYGRDQTNPSHITKEDVKKERTDVKMRTMYSNIPVTELRRKVSKQISDKNNWPVTLITATVQDYWIVPA